MTYVILMLWLCCTACPLAALVLPLPISDRYILSQPIARMARFNRLLALIHLMRVVESAWPKALLESSHFTAGCDCQQLYACLQVLTAYQQEK